MEEETKVIADVGKLDLPNNQLPVTSVWQTPAFLDDRTKVKSALAELEQKFEKLYDPDKQVYRSWDTFNDPPRQRPSQATTFEQLKFRFEQRKPIMAAVVAPAGFGKASS